MSKLLSIIVPFYKETETEIFPLLTTISTQKGIDLSMIEVLLVNDGYYDTAINNTSFSVLKQLDIKLLKMKINKGPGVTRQYGLDNATGKYIIFCDCDDLLHSVGVLGAMTVEMELTNSEYLSTSWLEEYKNDDNVAFITHDIESTWLHGKMFLREFLINKNIRFHDELRVHEDTYFLSLVTDLAVKKQHMGITSYVWTYNPTSITRDNNAIYTFNSMGVFIEAVVYSARELIKRDRFDSIDFKISQLICYVYLITQSKEWRMLEAKPFVDTLKQSLNINMKGLWHIWDNLAEDYISEVYWTEFAKSPRGFVDITLQDWINEIKMLEL